MEHRSSQLHSVQGIKANFDHLPQVELQVAALCCFSWAQCAAHQQPTPRHSPHLPQHKGTGRTHDSSDTMGIGSQRSSGTRPDIPMRWCTAMLAPPWRTPRAMSAIREVATVALGTGSIVRIPRQSHANYKHRWNVSHPCLHVYLSRVSTSHES